MSRVGLRTLVSRSSPPARLRRTAASDPLLGHNYELFALGVLLVLGLLSRLWILVASGQFSSDEAVPGLMARHILNAHEFPVFFWGQDYFGAGEAYEIAALFGIFGFSPWLVFVPPLAASLVLPILTWRLGNLVGPKPSGLMAAIPMSVAPALLTRALVTSAGGFALSYALMFSALLCVVTAQEKDTKHPYRWIVAFATATGFACWIWQPALVALPPVLIIALVRNSGLGDPRMLLAALVPVVGGLAPALMYNAASGWPTLSALERKAAEAPLSGSTPMDQLQSFGSLLWLALGGGDDSLGGAVPLDAMLLGLGLVIGPTLIVWAARRAPDSAWTSRATVLAFLLTFLFAHTLVANNATRYLVPIVVGGSIGFGVVLALSVNALRIPCWPAIAIVLVTVGLSNLLTYPADTSLLATPQLASLTATRVAIAALEARGLRTGYADYWTAFPVDYLTGEEIIVAARVPFFWRARTDRYPPYTTLVDSVVDPGRLFALVDSRCVLEPYLLPLDLNGASYQVDSVARWRLVWNIHARRGDEAQTLMAWRAAINSSSC
jgi:hypothetical protein